MQLLARGRVPGLRAGGSGGSELLSVWGFISGAHTSCFGTVNENNRDEKLFLFDLTFINRLPSKIQ